MRFAEFKETRTAHAREHEAQSATVGIQEIREFLTVKGNIKNIGFYESSKPVEVTADALFDSLARGDVGPEPCLEGGVRNDINGVLQESPAYGVLSENRAVDDIDNWNLNSDGISRSGCSGWVECYVAECKDETENVTMSKDTGHCSSAVWMFTEGMDFSGDDKPVMCDWIAANYYGFTSLIMTSNGSEFSKERLGVCAFDSAKEQGRRRDGEVAKCFHGKIIAQMI